MGCTPGKLHAETYDISFSSTEEWNPDVIMPRCHQIMPSPYAADVARTVIKDARGHTRAVSSDTPPWVTPIDDSDFPVTIKITMVKNIPLERRRSKVSSVAMDLRTSIRVRYESRLQDHQTLKAVALFNKGDWRGALKKMHLDDEDVRGAAAWLHHTIGLDTAEVGELLGDRDHVVLMEAYVRKLKLNAFSLDEALREFLKGFRLPGEAQKIDRLMDCFAKHWCESQARTSTYCYSMFGKAGIDGSLEFSEDCVGDSEPAQSPQMTPDVAYVVSFALIMLNTDLHNPQVKKKMTLSQFQMCLERVDTSIELPHTWTETLYNRIRDDEIMLKCTFTSRRQPQTLVSDLSPEMLQSLKLRRKFRAAVMTVMTSIKLMRNNPQFEPRPLVSILAANSGYLDVLNDSCDCSTTCGVDHTTDQLDSGSLTPTRTLSATKDMSSGVQSS